MTDKIESKGKTVQEAVNEALLQMGARKDEVRVEVLEEPRGGLFGILGSKQARVLVTRKPRRNNRGRQDFREKDHESVAHDLSDNSGGRKRGGRGRRSAPAARRDENSGSRKQDGKRDDGRRQAAGKDRAEKSNEGPRGSGRSRSRRGGRSRRNENNAPRPENQAQDSGRDRTPVAAEPEKRQPRSRRQEGNGGPGSRNEGQGEPRRDSRRRTNRFEERKTRSRRQEPAREQPGKSNRDEARAETREKSAATMERDMAPDEIILAGIKATKYAEPLRGVPEDKLDETLGNLTNGMLIRAGFPIRCEVKPGDYRQVRIITDDSSAGMLIGRHGSTVDSVEHLVERMAGIAMGDRVRMNLDINNYRRRREETLQDRVNEAAAMVLENGRTYHMEPMCARERRIVHLQVENKTGVRTFTMGGAGGKHVVLAPDNGEEGPEERKEREKRGDDLELEGSNAAAAENESPHEEQPSFPAEEFDEFDDGPQPETNELVVDDDDDRRPLI